MKEEKGEPRKKSAKKRANCTFKAYKMYEEETMKKKSNKQNENEKQQIEKM
jgi:hypothetical protein